MGVDIICPTYFGLASSHNCIDPFLEINHTYTHIHIYISVCVYIYPTDSVLENPDYYYYSHFTYEERSTERLNNLFKFILLVSGKAKIHTQEVWLKSPYSGYRNPKISVFIASVMV